MSPEIIPGQPVSSTPAPVTVTPVATNPVAANVTPPAATAPSTPPTTGGSSSSSVAQQQVQQTAAPKPPLITEALDYLDALASKWLVFSGKINHNPSLQISKLITPIVNDLKKQMATAGATVLTEVQSAKVQALPVNPPVIDPNYVATATNSAPQATKLSA